MNRSSSTRRRFRPGFTLVEAVCAIVIISIALPGMFWAMRDAQTKRADPVLANRARLLAQERLEDIIADRHSSTRGYAYVVSGNYASEAAVTGFSNMARSVAITESGANLVGGSGTGYKTVAVTVTFRDGRNTLRTLTLSTVLTDYTP
ncbi:MAG: type II secretion system GspH family protein [Phycisphaerales bacterium]|nr:type II secretion system GspH family protein [Phycisphaerales bacterium]